MDVEHFFQGLDAVFASGGTDDIEAYLNKSLSAADTEGDQHAAVAILNEIAGFYRNISRYAEAITAVERAVLLMQQLGYENTISYGTTLLNAATAYRASGDSVKALEFFLVALTAFGKELPEHDYRFAGLFNNISAVYKDMGKAEDALDALHRAEAVMEKNPGMKSDMATVQTNLALVLLELGREAEALQTLEKAQTLFRGNGGADGEEPAPHYAAALAGIGEACHRMNRYAEAVEHYEAALGHLVKSFGENRDFAVICENCAAACEAAGKPQKAMEYALRAKAILERLGLEG